MQYRRHIRRMLASDAVYPLLLRNAGVRDGVVVFTYHALAPDSEHFDAWVVARLGDFRRQMDFLRSRFHVVSLADAARRLAQPLPTAGTAPLAVVTFDDGHGCLFEHLLPVVEAEALPVTIYVATGHVETRQPYWFDRLVNALQVESAVSIDLEHHGLGRWQLGGAPGSHTWNRAHLLFEALKRVSPDRREAATDEAVTQLSRTSARAVRALRPLRIGELGQLARCSAVTIGAHSHCHGLLDQLDEAAAAHSMQRSRELLEQWTEGPVRHFAYPNGNFTSRLEALAAQAGFETAVTTQPGIWRKQDRLHAIPRLSIGRDDGLEGLKLALAAASRATGPRPPAQVIPLLSR